MRPQCLVFGAALACLIHSAATCQVEPKNMQNWAKSRQKRYLIFQDWAVHKLLLNLVLPVELNDKRPWRSLMGAWNFQWQHSLPLTALQWWNSTYFPAKARFLTDDATTSVPVPMGPEPIDLTATFIYAMIESYMNNNGMKGRQCLLRSICQNAQVRFVGGVLDHIYKRLLTPEETMDADFRDAYVMGTQDVDCYKTFRCPRGQSVFDRFVQIEDFN